ncbi:MAG: polysaccharide deacetylase family protein [Thermoanaerobaculales bacterium]
MNRRAFLRSLAAGTAGALLAPSLSSAASRPQVAVTMDDPKVDGAPTMGATEINRRILGHLERHRIKAALFVCGMRVDNPDGKRLLGEWNDAGHTLGNHSYSHWYLPSEKITLAAFCGDIARGEAVVSGFSHFRKIFRYPFFKEGDTVEKRDGVRRFLTERGYRVGRATVDASDWAIDRRLVARLRKDPTADLQPYREFYLAHIWERARYYDDLALQVLGQRPRHTVLVHHSLLNALFLGDLLEMFRARGWESISAEAAYRDPVYSRQPMTLPAGESLIWALAKETGRFEGQLRYPGEDDVYENPKMDKLGL